MMANHWKVKSPLLFPIHQLSHLSIFWHLLLSALMWLNLWYIVRGFSQWQDYKMPDTSLLVPLKFFLNMFLFDTNYSWSVGGKPDPMDSSNSCEGWEVNSSFRIWHKNLASNQANFLFKVCSGENKEHMFPCLIFGTHPQSKKINFMDYTHEDNKYFRGKLFLPSPTIV